MLRAIKMHAGSKNVYILTTNLFLWKNFHISIKLSYKRVKIIFKLLHMSKNIFLFVKSPTMKLRDEFCHLKTDQ